MTLLIGPDTVRARLLPSAGNPLGAMHVDVQRAGVAFELRPVIDCGDERHELLLFAFPAFAELASYVYARPVPASEPPAPAVFIRP